MSPDTVVLAAFTVLENHFEVERAHAWPAVALGEVRPPGRLLRPATPASFLSVGSGRPLSSLQPLVRLCLPILSSVCLLASSSFSFTLVFFFLLVFDVRVFIVFHSMAHIPFIHPYLSLTYFHIPFIYPYIPFMYLHIPLIYSHTTYIPSHTIYILSHTLYISLHTLYISSHTLYIPSQEFQR